MAVLCHCVLCKDTDQFSAACLSADDGLHDEFPKGFALNAVNTEGYRNDEFKAIHIIADAVVLTATLGKLYVVALFISHTHQGHSPTHLSFCTLHDS